MSDLFNKYHGKRLSTDEAAQVRNEIATAIKELESINYLTGPDSLLLKWGTLKSWDMHGEKAVKLLKKYGELGMSTTGAMNQHDTNEQKNIICQLIDEVDGVIQSDWSGDYFTKEEAKKYVMEYSA